MKILMKVFPVVAVLLLSGVAGAQSTPTPAEDNAAISSLQATFRQDQRVLSMQSDDRAFILGYVRTSFHYCRTTPLLNDMYDCSCFTQKSVDYRADHINVRESCAYDTYACSHPNEKEPITTEVQHFEFGQCVVPDQAKAYAVQRVGRTIRPPQYPQSQIDAIANCTGNGFANAYTAQPTPENASIAQKFNAAFLRCRRNANSYGSLNPAPTQSEVRAAAQPSNQTSEPPVTRNAVGDGSSMTTQAAAPVPPQHHSMMDRFNQLKKQASGALNPGSGTGSSGIQPVLAASQSTSSPVSTPLHSQPSQHWTKAEADTHLAHSIPNNASGECNDAFENGATLKQEYLYEAANVKLVACLVEHGADVNAPWVDPNGRKIAAPVWAQIDNVDNKPEQDYQYLIEHGADPNSISTTGQPLLAHFIDQSRYKDVVFLVEHGADVNIIGHGTAGGPHTYTMLQIARKHAAASPDKPEAQQIVDYLISKGAK